MKTNFFLFTVLFFVFAGFTPGNIPKMKCVPRPGLCIACDSISNLYRFDGMAIILTNALDPRDSNASMLVIEDSLVEEYKQILICFYNNLPDSLNDLRRIHTIFSPREDSFNICILNSPPGKYLLDLKRGDFGTSALESLAKKCGLVFSSEFQSRNDTFGKKIGWGTNEIYDHYTFKTKKIINVQQLQKELQKISPYLGLGGGTTYFGSNTGNFFIKKENGKTILQVFQTFYHTYGQWHQVKRVFDVTVPGKLEYISYKSPAWFNYDQ